ncbi:MAG: hypothetical protein MUF31_17460 [Akkermansiaceae bacterium]|nr:hypothetical protein [Akkermansiaceae bacterium]
MKKPPFWTWNVLGVALALGAGILIGRSSSTSGGDGSVENDAANPPPRLRAGVEASGAASPGSRDARRAGGADDAAARAEGGLAGVMDSNSRIQRIQGLLAMLDRLPTEEFASVYAEMMAMPGADLRGTERSLILQAWAERDPASAIAYIQENNGDDYERETVLGTWAAIDPQGAMAWAMTASDEGQVNNWVLGALRGVADGDPELAKTFLASMEGNETRRRALREMQRYVTRYGYDYAENWISTIEDPGLRNEASRRMGDELAELDPARAAVWNSGIEDRDTRRDVSEEVADRWARTDLNQAVEWVNSLPADTQSEAAEGVARHWARQDPAAAGQWLAGLGNNPDLDGARRIYIEESFRYNPQASLEFVSQISDERARTGYYFRYLGGWMREDRDAARQWAEANAASLPAPVVERMLR